MMVDQALTFAAQGWPVFPCKPGQKLPATRHGFKDATTDPDQIQSWWGSMPQANLAIATGWPGPDVVDVDVKGINDGRVALERVRRAGLVADPMALVETPSGGIHLYFAGTDQANGTLPGHGIDFRSLGGYVLTAPSVIDGRPYRVIESQDSDRSVSWDRIRRFLAPPPPLGVTTVHDFPARCGDIGHLADWVARQGEGNRNHGLYWAAHRALEDGHHDLSPLVTAAIVVGLSATEAEATVESARKKVDRG